ncbi:hypothetical protein [Kitasatospora sp. NE20-6]|uniref:hypothetical protein n=1 Tax=Kitasatospora sp. NE20-6 TaxID=2859066 RepID=UPI0038B278A7
MFVLLPVAGCSPPQRDIVGVRVGEDGEPVLMLRSCDGSDFERVEIFVGPDSMAHLTPPEGTHGRVDIRMFHPPTDWRSTGDSLPPLAAGERAWVDLRSSDIAYSVLHFTADDLARMAPGEVWAGEELHSPAGFEAYVRDAC